MHFNHPSIQHEGPSDPAEGVQIPTMEHDDVLELKNTFVKDDVLGTARIKSAHLTETS